MSQVQNGKAFEWAIAISLERVVGKFRKVVIVESLAQQDASRHFESLSDVKKIAMGKAAVEAVAHICEDLERRLSTLRSDDLPIYVSIMPDASGQAGDVRDLVIIEGHDWEVGISAKHNHAALKHPRVPAKKGIVDAWLGFRSSEAWFKDMEPVYYWLNRHAGEKWSDRSDTFKNVYAPTLRALCAELWHVQEQGHPVAERLLRYCIGNHDFYKVIYSTAEKKVIVQAFNLSGTLGRDSSGARSRRVSVSPLPKSLGKFHLSGNTLYIRMDEGWQISMRIHSADSEIKRSGLKFDVQLEGHPPQLYTHHISIK